MRRVLGWLLLACLFGGIITAMFVIDPVAAILTIGITVGITVVIMGAVWLICE